MNEEQDVLAAASAPGSPAPGAPASGILRAIAERARALREKRFNPQALAAFRLAFGAIDVLFALGCLDQFLLTHGTVANPDLLYGIGVCWLVLAICLTVGVASFAVRLLHFLAITVYLTVGEGNFGVEPHFFLLGSFWILFIDLPKSRLYPSEGAPAPKAYPVVFLCAGLAADVLYLGFWGKFLDPMWRYGVGYYYVFHLPWIKPAWLHAGLFSSWLNTLMNYVALSSEALIFPLFLIRKTRWIACLLFAGFAVQLFVLNISLIGEVALAFSLAFAGLYMDPDRIYVRLRSRLEKPRAAIDALNTALSWRGGGAHRLELASMGIGVTLLCVGVCSASLSILQANVPSLRSVPLVGVEGLVSTVLRAISLKTVRIKYARLFSSEHFIGVLEYRVLVVLRDGRVLEPVEIFTEDLLSGSATSQRFKSGRWLQAEMYRVPMVLKCARLPKSEIPPVPPWVVRLFAYVLSKAEGEDVIRMEFLVAPVPIPQEPARACSAEFKEQPWTRVLTWEADARRLHYEDVSEFEWLIRSPKTGELLRMTR